MYYAAVYKRMTCIAITALFLLALAGCEEGLTNTQIPASTDTPTVESVLSPTSEPTATGAPTVEPTVVPAPTPTPAATATVSLEPTRIPIPATSTPNPDPSPISPTATIFVVPTQGVLPTRIPTTTPTPTQTSTPTPTITPTPIPRKVSGFLASSETWHEEDGDIRLTASLVIPADMTLTIEPGVSIWMDDNTQVIVEGTLTVNGTADSRVTFVATGAGWSGIHASSSASQISLTGCEIRGVTSNYIVKSSSSGGPVSISDCVFESNSSDGIHVANKSSFRFERNYVSNQRCNSSVSKYKSFFLDIQNPRSDVLVSDNSFTSNICGLVLIRATSSPVALTVDVSDNVFENNSSASVILKGESNGGLLRFAVANNTFSDNTVTSAVVQLFTSSPNDQITFDSNTMTSNIGGNSLSIAAGHCNSSVGQVLVTGNTIIENTNSVTLRLFFGLSNGFEVSSNHIASNESDLLIDLATNCTIPHPILSGNNIIENAVPKLIQVRKWHQLVPPPVKDIDASNNFWGTLSEVEIKGLIVDHDRDPFRLFGVIVKPISRAEHVLD